jgi:hypothetical protein
MYFPRLFYFDWLDLIAFLVENKKIMIFDPMKGPLFSEQCGMIFLVFYGSSHRNL